MIHPPIVLLLDVVVTGMEVAELGKTMEKLILHRGNSMFLRTSMVMYKMGQLGINIL